MMALSCINYINISLGIAGKRLTEIGIRKAIGGKKIQLVAQFMTENLLLCFLALLLGLLFAHQFLIPLFNASQTQQISLSLSQTPNLWLFLIALFISSVLLHSMGKQWMNLDWGYQPDETFMVRLDHAEQYDILKNEVASIPYVQKVAGSVNHV